jgi:hypothetical protein
LIRRLLADLQELVKGEVYQPHPAKKEDANKAHYDIILIHGPGAKSNYEVRGHLVWMHSSTHTHT